MRSGSNVSSASHLFAETTNLMGSASDRRSGQGRTARPSPSIAGQHDAGMQCGCLKVFGSL